MQQIYLFFATILLFLGLQGAAFAAAGGEGAATEKAPMVLVAYFSCTGTTEATARQTAEALGADLHEIRPAEPYTNADLDYRDKGSRSTLEMNDAGSRPALAGTVANMAEYDVVFLGYPIWWGQAPRIVATFLEAHDLSGKTIVPFCTSGGSGLGSSDRELHARASGATWLPGRRISGSLSGSDVLAWVEGLGLPLAVK